ncbi:MAG: sensor histidine kinase [Treponema sp.]
MNKIIKQKKTFYLSVLVKLILIFASVVLAVCSVLFFVKKNFTEFIFAFISFAFVFSTSLFCIVQEKKTSKLLELFLDGNPASVLKLIKLNYSLSVEKLLNLVQHYAPKDARQEENKRQAQYLALQNQINPHFLYNTLEAIRSEALIGGLELVADMSETLANFFRYTISNTAELVTLPDELKNVRDYFAIQKFRFGDRINLVINIPSDSALQFFRMPKLILQPIVENAIIHGLESKVNGGVITISSRLTSERTYIIIEDNGQGIDYEQLIHINKNLSVTQENRRLRQGTSNNGIAIYNVNDRIQLLYGEEYGLTYYSMQQVGTTVEIALPAVKGIL